MKLAARLLAILAALSISAAAFGQSAPQNPQMTYGMVPTVGQWINWFEQKQDTLGYIPVNRNGDVMQGRLVIASTYGAGTLAGFNIVPGTAPSAPAAGDMWMTSAGLYFQVGGVTVGPLGPAPAASIFMNPTASTASPQNTALSSLTALPSPDATQDLIPIYDHVSGTIKTTTPTAIAASGTLPSIAAGHLIANSGASTATAGDTVPSAWMDRAFGSSAEATIQRNSAGTWIANNQNPVNAVLLGADPTGVSDSTTAIQNAINTGRPVYLPQTGSSGCYKVSADLTISTKAQAIFGDGRTASRICVNSAGGFSTGVFVCSTGEEGPYFHDFGIFFTQPDTSSRGSLTTYKPAIACNSTARFVIRHMHISNATIGVQMTGNSGGSLIDDLELSAFTHGVEIDGALDTVRINKLHFYPFDMTNNTLSIFQSSGTTGLYVGRVDGLFVHQFMSIAFQAMNFHQGSDGQQPLAFISDSDFDSFNGILQTYGQVSVTNSLFTIVSGGAYNAVLQSGTGGAQMSIDNSYVLNAGSTFAFNNGATNGVLAVSNSRLFQVSGAYLFYANGSASNLILTGNYADLGTNTSAAFAYADTATSPVNLHVENNVIHTVANIAYANSIIVAVSGSRCYISGNRANDKGTNAATFIAVLADNFNWVSGNMAPGWTLVLPASSTGYYANNPH